ncbi:MAG: hypothetical protein JWM20_326 [Patescibacteria group bacterium]|nr:hypothetical protein [Patescibacteria group bacterium]
MKHRFNFFFFRACSFVFFFLAIAMPLEAFFINRAVVLNPLNELWFKIAWSITFGIMAIGACTSFMVISNKFRKLSAHSDACLLAS